MSCVARRAPVSPSRRKAAPTLGSPLRACRAPRPPRASQSRARRSCSCPPRAPPRRGPGRRRRCHTSGSDRAARHRRHAAAAPPPRALGAPRRHPRHRADPRRPGTRTLAGAAVSTGVLAACTVLGRFERARARREASGIIMAPSAPWDVASWGLEGPAALASAATDSSERSASGAIFR